MAHVEHLRVDVSEDVFQAVIAQHVKAQVWRIGNREVMAHLRRRHVLAVVRCRTAGVVAQHRLGFGLKLGGKMRPFVGFLYGVGQGKTGHRVGSVGHQPAVFRGDAQPGEAVGQGRAAYQHRNGHAVLTEVADGFDHHLRRLHQQPGQPDDVGVVLPTGFDEVLGRYLDAQVDNLVPVVGQDDFH